MTDPQQRRAYRTSLYRVLDRGSPFDMTIDVPSAPLAALHARHRVISSAFVTAWNPHSRKFTKEQNVQAQQQLREQLAARAIVAIESEGVAEDLSWREDSVLALGLTLDDAVALGRQFGQNAIVFAGADAVPRLVEID